MQACRRREARVVSSSDEISLHNHSVGVGRAASHAVAAPPRAGSAQVAAAAPQIRVARAGSDPAPSRLGPAGASELFQGSGEEAVEKKATQNSGLAGWILIGSFLDTVKSTVPSR